MSRVAIRNFILILLLLLILVVLFFLLRPSSTQETATTPGSTGAGQGDKTIDLAISGGNTMTPGEINVNEGDHLTLRITSDEPLEVHLHGYDLEKEVEANQPEELTFDATNTGRFEIEAHLGQAEQELGELLVQPR